MTSSGLGEYKVDSANKKDHWLWWLVAVGLLGILVYLTRCHEVFPSASIELTISRQEILAQSQKWAKSLGYNQSDTIKSTIFSFDNEAKTFLEYELGLSEANKLMTNQVPVWYWSTRLCHPLALEEFGIEISPQGRLVSFEHSLDNEHVLPTIAHEDARKLAIKFVEQKAGLSLKEYKLVEDGSVSQPHRTDHYFTWEDAHSQLKGAKLRAYAYVAGNMMTKFNYFLFIPETWLRKFSQLRSYNAALEEVASIFYVTFNTATFFAFIWAFTSGRLRWRFALAVSSFVAILDLAESLNSLPNAIHNYATTMSYRAYLADVYVDAAWGALSQLLQTFVLVGAAESLYRVAHPTKIALERIVSKAGLRSRQVITGLIAGHGMFGMHLGWVVLYYLYGRNLGVWSPLEVRTTAGLSSVVPFYSSMYIGATAAIFEELTYRVLGMSIFQRLVKHFWLANLLQAAAWAFMHSNYPQEPPWARGVELTAVGAFYGWVVKRYGLIPCIISHYVFDTFLGVAPLLDSSLLSLKLPSVFAVIPFLVVLAVSLWLSKGSGALAEEQTLQNSQLEPVTRASEIEEVFPHTPYTYVPLPGRLRKILAVVAVVGAFIAFSSFSPLVGQDSKLSISRQEAIDAATRYLQKQGISAQGRYKVAWLSGGLDLEALQYVFERAKFAKTDQLVKVSAHPLVWKVRFFRPLDPEEYLVCLDGDGNPLSLGVVLAEDAPGARLAQKLAQEKVEGYLKMEHPEMVPFQFDDVSEERLKNRTDWDFTYKVPKYKIGDADYKIIISTVGQLVSNFDQSWELPDKWRWERSTKTLKDQLSNYLVAALGLIIFIAGLWWMIGVARSGAIRWRPAVFFALVVTLLVLPQSLNALPEFFVGYGTDTPLLSYFIAEAVRLVLRAVSSIGAAAALAAFGLASFRMLFPKISVASIFRASLMTDNEDRGAVKRNLWLDAVLIGYALGLGFLALHRLSTQAFSWISPNLTVADAGAFCAMANMFNPSLAAIMTSVSRGIGFVVFAGVSAGLYAKYCRNFKVYLLLSILVSLVYPSTVRYWQDYVVNVLVYLAWCLIFWLMVAKLGRQNLLAYFLSGAIMEITSHILLLENHGANIFASDIVCLTLVALSPLIYLGVIYRAPRRPRP